MMRVQRYPLVRSQGLLRPERMPLIDTFGWLIGGVIRPGFHMTVGVCVIGQRGIAMSIRCHRGQCSLAPEMSHDVVGFTGDFPQQDGAGGLRQLRQFPPGAGTPPIVVVFVQFEVNIQSITQTRVPRTLGQR